MGKQRPVLSGLMAVIGVVALYRAEVKPRMYAWGARDENVAAPLPCDELIRADGPRTTRAVTIDAPVESVWPWIAQIGEDRAGFYSYSWLERAAGAMIHNANVIHPEWQELRVGDTVWLARRYGEAARQVVHRENGWTSLLVRGSGGAVGHAVFDIPHFVMEQKMMRGMRDRAQEAFRKQVRGTDSVEAAANA